MQLIGEEAATINRPIKAVFGYVTNMERFGE